MIDFFVLVLVFFAGLNFPTRFKNGLSSKNIKILRKLWFFHLVFGLLYWAYISYGRGGDAYFYWYTGANIDLENALQGFLVEGPGTNVMHLLNAFPAKFLSFFGLSMLYSLVGYFGLVYFYIIFERKICYNSKLLNFNLFPIVFFLPNLHFWSAGIGKDTILFFCIGLFFFGIIRIKNRVPLILFALTLAYLIRPHIAIFLIASTGLGYLYDGNLKGYYKALFFGIFLVGFILLFDNLMAYLKIENLDTQSLNQFAETRVSNLSRSGTGSSVDISNYPIPLKIFTFLYRPLFFDINNVLAVVASFENLILLILSWKLFRVNPIRVFKKGNYLIKSMFLFLIMGSISFSLILGNLGIMLRQKNMFIPSLLFLCLYGLSYQQERKMAKEQRRINS